MAKGRQIAGTVEEQVETLLCELKVFGFAAVKEIARLRGQLSGTMPCPMCGNDLRFGTAPSNNHFRVCCTRDGCLKAME